MEGKMILAKIMKEIEDEKMAIANGACNEQDYDNCYACGKNDCNPEPFVL